MSKSTEKEIAEEYEKVRNLRRNFKKKLSEEELDYVLIGNKDKLPKEKSVKVHSSLLEMSVSESLKKTIKENEQKVYELKSVQTENILFAIHELMYNGTFLNVKMESVDEYLELEKCLKSENLNMLLLDFNRVFYRDMVNPSKYLSNLKQLSMKPDTKELHEMVCDQFSKSTNFLISKRRKEFLVLSFEEFDRLSSDSSFTPTKEIFFLRLIISWARYDFEKRSEHLQTLLNKVSFAGLLWEDYSVLRAQLTRDKRFRVIMKQFFKRYMEYMHKFMPEIIELRNAGEHNYHVRYNRPYVLLCPDAEASQLDFTLYSTIDMQEIEEEGVKWLSERIPEKPKIKTSNIFLTESKNLFIVDKEVSLTVYKLDLNKPKSERKWDKIMCEENFPRYTTAVMVGDEIYFMGGMINETRRKTVLQLNINKPKFELVESKISMIEPAVAASSCNEKSKIFVTGGVDHKNSSIPDCQYYDITSKDPWAALPKMKHSRTTHSCHAQNGRLYVVGGSTPENRESYPTEYLDIGDQNWTSLAMTSFPHSQCSLISLCKSPTYKELELLIFDKHGERYDPAERKWLPNQLCLSSKGYSSHVVMPMKLLE